MANRDFVITDGENNITVFAVCPHCSEPFCIIGIVPSGSLVVGEVEPKTVSFCRGANALSFRIRCCEVLQCASKKFKEGGCNLLPSVKGQIFPIGKWNTIVAEVPLNV
jgi:hypothetical protein